VSFVIQRSSGGGLALTQVRRDLLRIGRGTNSELRSENAAVALEHAVIEGDANGFTITDKGSITGTYVNRRPVETARLAKGDVIEIGDLRIEVQVLEPGKPLFVRVSVASSSAYSANDDEEDAVPSGGAARGGVLKAPKIDYVDAFRLRRPWLTKLSMIAILMIIALLIINELAKPKQRAAFMPGGMSSKHATKKDVATGATIGKNCRACHDPWHGVSDNGCTKCHGMKPHSELQTAAPACADCHPEHRDVAKVAKDADATCVSCHGDLLAHVKDRALLATRPKDELAITFFGTRHPDFSPRGDPDKLRFNHAFHLNASGIPDGEGRREVMQCVQCHKLVETKGIVDPVRLTFKDHCQRCHKLTFDPRYPQVPHGVDLTIVYGAIMEAYAGNRDIVGKSPEETRRILTSLPRVATDSRAAFSFEQVKKTKCIKCHDIDHTGSRIAVKPEIPTRWLLRAKFTHTKHQDLSCESCHETARGSTTTSDVLVPLRGNCTKCHGVQSAKISRCTTCHAYHEHSRLLTAAMSDLGGGSEMIEKVALWAIVLLLLVVLLPAGVALVQRIRAGTPDRAAAVRRQASSDPITAKVPPLRPSDTPAVPAPPPAPRKEPASTRLAPVPTGPPPPQATEMVQWYGMLQCTSGALEGQHFIIEEGGLYIGRDPAMSQVAISDNRISKRHVRIVPRDGKVRAIDQNSTNGTFLGNNPGVRITDVELKRGDTIILGDGAAAFLFQM
jgi:pSer/pThr/pTyr-binding forkhead associated (FHA) protein